MENSQHNVFASFPASTKLNIAEIRANLISIAGLESAKADVVIERIKVAEKIQIAKNVTLQEAEAIKAKFEATGLVCEFTQPLSLVPIANPDIEETCCPSCNQAVTFEADGKCPECGIYPAKMAEALARKKILADERKKLEQLRYAEQKAKEQESAAERERRLRQEARDALGLNKPKQSLMKRIAATTNPIKKTLALTTVVVLLGSGFVLIQHQQKIATNGSQNNFSSTEKTVFLSSTNNITPEQAASLAAKSAQAALLMRLSPATEALDNNGVGIPQSAVSAASAALFNQTDIIEVNGSIARDQAEAGDRLGAENLLANSTALIGSISEAAVQSAALDSLNKIKSEVIAINFVNEGKSDPAAINATKNINSINERTLAVSNITKHESKLTNSSDQIAPIFNQLIDSSKHESNKKTRTALLDSIYADEVSAYCQIAKNQIKLGKTAEAKASIELATQSSDHISNAGLRAKSIGLIAKNSIANADGQNGELFFDHALKLSEVEPDIPKRITALGEIAKYQTESGNSEAAKKLYALAETNAESTSLLIDQVNAYTKLAEAYAEAGRVDDYGRSIKKVMGYVNSMADEHLRESARSTLYKNHAESLSSLGLQLTLKNDPGAKECFAKALAIMDYKIIK